MKWFPSKIILILLFGISACVHKEHIGETISTESPEWLKQELAKYKKENFTPQKQVISSTAKVQTPKTSQLQYDRVQPTQLPQSDFSGTLESISDVTIAVENVQGIKSSSTKDGEIKRQLVLSPIESLYYSLPGLSNKRILSQFGYATIKNSLQVKNTNNSSDPSMAADSSNPHLNIGTAVIDSSYIIGPGDELIIRSTGGFAIDQSSTINRDNSLFIPRVGEISLTGVSAGNLKSVIEQKISEEFNNFSLSVKIGRLHTIKVLFSGNLEQPGMKLIPSNSTLLEALITAGGPTKQGTLRSIVLRRKGIPPRTIDIYDVLTGKSRGGDVTLQSGDHISVERIGATIAFISPSISGIYEITPKTSLQNLIEISGGLDHFVQRSTILIERTNDNSERSVDTLSFAEASNRILNDGDVIVFQQIDTAVNNTVTIKGQVVRPGTYPFTKGFKASDLLQLSEGFLLGADLERALIIRQLGDLDTFDNIPGDKTGRTQEQRIWLDLAAILSGDTTADLPLKRLDSIQIVAVSENQSQPYVRILGAVRRPGEYTKTSQLNLGDLIKLAGGPTDTAFTGESTIIRRSTGADSPHLDIIQIPFSLQSVLNNGSGASIRLENYDQIIIRAVQSLQVTVSIAGRVQFPGTYILSDEARISDLIVAAGGLLDKADLPASFFSRARIRDLQRDRLNDLLIRMKEDFQRTRSEVRSSGTTAETTGSEFAIRDLQTLEQNMKSIQPTGRIILDFVRKDFLESSENLKLENGDTLIIPQKMNTIAIMGRVRSPNVFVWKPTMDIESYIERSGDYLDDADTSEVYVVKANGEVRLAPQNFFGRLMNPFTLRPGDTVLIPQKVVDRSSRRVFDDYVYSLRGASNLGISAATMGSIIQSDASSAEVSIGSNVNVTSEDSHGDDKE